MTRAAIAWLLLVPISACGGDDGGTTVGSEATSASDGSTTMSATSGVMSTTAPEDTTGGTGTAADDTAGSSETAAPVCPEDTPAEGPAVTISLRNDRATAIFVTSQFDCTESHLRIDTDSDPPGRWPLEQCAPTCASIIADACECADACAQPGLIRIEPGGTHELAWDGALWVEHELAAECNACGVAPDCLLGVSAPAGMVLASAGASSTATDCTDEAGEPSTCECARGEDSCVLVGTATDPQEIAAQAVFEYPRTTSLELVFDET